MMGRMGERKRMSEDYAAREMGMDLSFMRNDNVVENS